MCQYVDIVGELANVLTIRFNDGQISKTDFIAVESRLKEAEIRIKARLIRNIRWRYRTLNSLMGVSPLEPDRGGRFHYAYLGLAVASKGKDARLLRNRPTTLFPS